MAQSTITSATPGNMVVPLSAIIDQLQGRMSAADLNALLLAVVGQRKSEVRPGDLITAEFMNQVLAQIEDLSSRVAFLEGTLGKQDSVVITALVPQDGNVKVGEQIRVIGKNFDYTKNLLRAHIDRYPISGYLTGTSDELLIFTVPRDIADVPAGGRPAIFTVSNNNSSAQTVLFLRPSVSLAGFFELNEINTRPSGATPTANQSFTMEYEVVSQVNLDTTIDVTAVVTGPSNTSDWQRRVVILNADETINAEGRFPIAMRERKRFLVRIDPIPLGTAIGIGFSLEAQVAAGTVIRKRPLGFTVGTRYAAPDNTISLNFSSGEIRPVGGRGSSDATGIRITAGGAAKLVFAGTFEQAGSYDLTITAPTGWRWQFTDGTASPVVVAPSELTAAGVKAAKNLHFTVWPDTNPAGSGEIVLTLQRQGASAARVATLNASLLS